jgi:hypothetical protein
MEEDKMNAQEKIEKYITKDRIYKYMWKKSRRNTYRHAMNVCCNKIWCNLDIKTTTCECEYYTFCAQISEQDYNEAKIALEKEYTNATNRLDTKNAPAKSKHLHLLNK